MMLDSLANCPCIMNIYISMVYYESVISTPSTLSGCFPWAEHHTQGISRAVGACIYVSSRTQPPSQGPRLGPRLDNQFPFASLYLNASCHDLRFDLRASSFPYNTQSISYSCFVFLLILYDFLFSNIHSRRSFIDTNPSQALYINSLRKRSDTV